LRLRPGQAAGTLRNLEMLQDSMCRLHDMLRLRGDVAAHVAGAHQQRHQDDDRKADRGGGGDQMDTLADRHVLQSHARTPFVAEAHKIGSSA